ncbi:MAG: hypothetical protein R3F43_31470 [bacterium]
MDAGLDAQPRDMGPPRDMFTGTDIQSCEDARKPLRGCERIGEIFGDEEACLDRCARITRTGERPDAWWDCLGVEECNLLQLCRCLPTSSRWSATPSARGPASATPPSRLRGHLRREAGAAFRQCGESLVGGCGVDAFVECLGAEVYPACQRTRAQAPCSATSCGPMAAC